MNVDPTRVNTVVPALTGATRTIVRAVLDLRAATVNTLAYVTSHRISEDRVNIGARSTLQRHARG